ncbi:MAG: helix-turn-helix domain-containing protein [Candidatus Dormibacteraeota bacterium]|uniref:Helix-turn-helix domain-containing protein n=1 Tax=Candidatus Amunia macphersoniae TaxID=3127014 RepID=A0A934KF13_9BACT|nr:helix-turn-helix domain-containing protein [Candidatus Dormibacteraeota bacterium]
MGTLGQLVETLRSCVIEVVVAPAGVDHEVCDVVIVGQGEAEDPRRGDLVLAVGMSDERSLLQLVSRLGVAHAAGLIVKGDQPTGRLSALAESAGIALMTVPISAAWLQVGILIRTALARDTPGSPWDSLGGAASGDLFAMANAVSALVDAPVTIEDSQSRVLAYSGRQEEADRPRVETILGRQIPEPHLQRLREARIFQRLRHETGVVYYEDPDRGVKPRAIVGVRAGDELLGSIWAVFEPPFRAEQEAALLDSSKVVAVHLLRHRLGVEVHRNLQNDLVGAVLNGGQMAADAAMRLSLYDVGYRVVALSCVEREGVDESLQLTRLWDLLSVHVSSVHPRAVTGLMRDVVYAILPLGKTAETGLAVARQTMERFFERASTRLQAPVLAGIGGHARAVAEIPRSKVDAEETLRVLRSRDVAPAQADIDDVRLQVMLLDLANLHAGQPLGRTKLTPLVEHDQQHHTEYVLTLREYLDAFGDLKRAARQLEIHPNTIRYRLRKLGEVSGIDLDDAEERLSLLLQLRLLRDA